MRFMRDLCLFYRRPLSLNGRNTVALSVYYLRIYLAKDKAQGDVINGHPQKSIYQSSILVTEFKHAYTRV